MLYYVDDLIHIGFKPKENMDALNMIYRLKEGFGTPNLYLSTNVERLQFKDGQVIWFTNCVDYLKSAIENVDNLLGVDKTALKNHGEMHRTNSSSFRPELDVTGKLGEELTNRYQQLIGLLRCSIELGRIDVLTKVSCLSQHLCYPREGHLDAVYCISRYLQKNLGRNPGRMTYNPMYQPTYENVFEVFGRDLDEWKYFYPDDQ